MGALEMTAGTIRPAADHGTLVRWRPVLLALALVLPLALTWGGQLFDVVHYFVWSQGLSRGEAPYRDMAVEYPPLAFALVVAPGLWTRSLWGFAASFMALVAAVAAAQKWALWRTVRRPGVALLVVCCMEAALYSTYLKRFDVFAAALTTAALLRLGARPGGYGGWVLLGLGAAVKLYPLFLLPLACAYAAPRVGRRRAWLTLPALTAAVALAPSLAAWLAWGPASASWLSYHAARGLHLPSSYTAAWVLGGHWGQPLTTGMRFGAIEVLDPWADAWARRASYVLVAALLATYAAVLPRLTGPSSLWRGALAVVAAVLAAAKVFSPQFVAWLVPLVAVAAVGQRTAQAELGGAGGAAGEGAQKAAPVDWVLLGLGLLLAVLTGELFPREPQLALPHAPRRAVLVARTAVLVVLWARALRVRWQPMGRASRRA